MKAWSHLRTHVSPANHPSRPRSYSTDGFHEEWIKGPQWLRDNVEPPKAALELEDTEKEEAKAETKREKMLVLMSDTEEDMLELKRKIARSAQEGRKWVPEAGESPVLRAEIHCDSKGQGGSKEVDESPEQKVTSFGYCRGDITRRNVRLPKKESKSKRALSFRN